MTRFYIRTFVRWQEKMDGTLINSVSIEFLFTFYSKLIRKKKWKMEFNWVTARIFGKRFRNRSRSLTFVACVVPYRAKQLWKVISFGLLCISFLLCRHNTHFSCLSYSFFRPHTHDTLIFPILLTSETIVQITGKCTTTHTTWKTDNFLVHFTPNV